MTLEDLIQEREKVKFELEAATDQANSAMKVWKEKSSKVTEAQNKLMKLNSDITLKTERSC